MLLNVQKLTARELLNVYVSILSELLRRGIIRTRNAPLGDLMEHIAAIAYEGVIEPNSKKSYDLVSKDGRRVQVKARGLGDGNKSQVFSAFRSWDFETALFVTVDAVSYDIVWARELTVAEAESIGRRRDHTNSTAVRVNSVLAHGIDVTERIRIAYSMLEGDIEPLQSPTVT